MESLQDHQDQCKKMVKLADEAGVATTTDLMNQIIVGITPADCKFLTIANCYNRREGTLERVNYKTPKFVEQIMKQLGDLSRS